MAAAASAMLPGLRAQDASVSVNASADGQWAQLPPLDQLLAPVALYPDPVLGLVLPASTQPGDLQAAAAGNSPGSDPAVQGLTHYPDVLQWMTSNESWSDQLGNAFAEQPSQVMDAVQDLRHRAMAAGTLQSNDQVEVVETSGVIQILPRQAAMVYIPHYDAGAVYFSGAAGISIAWGTGLPAGAWLSFYPAWDRHAFYTGDWYDYSRSHGGWHAQGGAGFAAMIGSSGSRGAKEWRVAGNAQIRSSKYRNTQSGRNYARPQAMSASAGTRSGPQPNRQQQAAANARTNNQRPATFSGDDYRQNDQNTQTNRSADEQRSNTNQTQPLYNRNGAAQPDTSAEQNRRESEQKAQAPENTQNQRAQVNESQAQRATPEQERASSRENPANENHPAAATSEHAPAERSTAKPTEPSSSAHPQAEAKPEKKSPAQESDEKNRAPSSEPSR